MLEGSARVYFEQDFSEEFLRGFRSSVGRERWLRALRDADALVRLLRCSDLKLLLNELKDETGFNGMELSCVLIYLRGAARTVAAEEEQGSGGLSDGG